MSSFRFSNSWSAVLIVLAIASGAAAQQDTLPAAEFSRLVRTMSEEGGYFFSDNFTSNEDSYLTVIDRMKQLGATGGAYIGVGPEQNFTYIAKVRPRIAFIVDIRRQAMIQHLMYKAIFHHANTRAEFISLLLSRQTGTKPRAPDEPIRNLVARFSKIPVDSATFNKNLSLISKTIEQDFQFPLSKQDRTTLDYVYKSFANKGFDIGFDIDDQWSGRFGHLPTLRELILQKDPKGMPGNFLATPEDYNFVRDMQRRNMIIPVVGDFGGKKALASIGNYLRRNRYVVTVFYASNVEIVLFGYGYGSNSAFAAFVDNIKDLPTNDRSILIRSTFYFYGHPQQLPGYKLCTMLQNISVFLKEYQSGQYREYRDLIGSFIK